MLQNKIMSPGGYGTLWRGVVLERGREGTDPELSCEAEGTRTDKGNEASPGNHLIRE